MLDKVVPAVIGAVGLAAYAGHLTYATKSPVLGLIALGTVVLLVYGFWQDIREGGS